MQRYQALSRLQAALASVVLASLLCLTACSASGSSSSTASATHTPAGSPTPVVAAGYYAFVRNGDVWARDGLAPSHAVTFLHLTAAGATWGPFAWSPDRALLAFILRAPPVAPGLAVGAPSQGTGTLFLVNLATGSITSLHGTATGVVAPLLGQHIAWVNSTTLLFTQDGTIEQATIGTSVAITPLNGPKSVWEIAVRNGTLFYSTLANVAPSGAGTAELHSFVLSGSDHHDQVVATLGAATLPATLCGLVCAPDATTPYVPYAWTVSADGTQIAYQQAIAGAVATATTAPTPTVSPAKTVTPAPTATTAPALATTRFMVAHADGTQAQPIFAQVPLPGDRADLAFSPDGHHIALAAADPGAALYTPYVQSLSGANQSPVALTPAAGSPVTLSGPLTWTPDNAGVTLTQNAVTAQATAAAAITFTLAGQRALTEQSAENFMWAS